MSIWVELEIRSLKGTKPGASLRSSALINTGFITRTPDLELPAPIARELGLWPQLKSEMISIRGWAFGGVSVEVWKLPEALEARVIVPDRALQFVICDGVIVQGENRILISDRLISKLGLDLVDAGEGIWRFRDDPPGLLRQSAKPRYW